MKCLFNLTTDTSTLTFVSQVAAFAVLDIITVFGNFLVIIAILKYRSLRSVNGLFLVSLAVADLSLGVFVLPFSSVNEVVHRWLFGTVWCRSWLIIDVLLCTSSIYNLVAISIDRYIAITRPLSYPNTVTRKRGRGAILFVWTLAFLISLPPLLYPSSSDSSETENKTSLVVIKSDVEDSLCQCTPLANSPGYIVYSSLGSFFIPMIVIIVIYFRIFLIVRQVKKSMYCGYLVNSSMTRGGSIKADAAEGALRMHRGGSTAYTPPENSASHNTMCAVKTRRQPSKRSVSPPTTRRRFPKEMNGVTHKRTSCQTVTNNSAKALLEPVLEDKGLLEPGGHERSASSPCVVEVDMQVRQQSSPRSNRSESSSLESSRAISTISTFHGEASADQKYSVGSSGLQETSLAGQPPVEKCLVFPVATRPSAGQIRDERNSVGSIDSVQSIPKAYHYRSPRLATAMGRMLQTLRKKKKTKSTYRGRFLLELKAAKTVAIVTSCFVFCWIGFAFTYILEAFEGCSNNQCVPGPIASFVFWLGYLNSALNPIIYALFNKQFRRAFKQILCPGSNNKIKRIRAL